MHKVQISAFFLSLFFVSSNAMAQNETIMQGEYTCIQGPSNLKLTMKPKDEGGLEAIFEFYSPRDGVSGAFSLNGSILPSGDFQLVPNRWIRQPAGFSMVGMSGKVNSNGRGARGRIDSQGCGGFSVDFRSGEPFLFASATPTEQSSQGLRTIPRRPSGTELPPVNQSGQRPYSAAQRPAAPSSGNTVQAQGRTGSAEPGFSPPLINPFMGSRQRQERASTDSSSSRGYDARPGGPDYRFGQDALACTFSLPAATGVDSVFSESSELSSGIRYRRGTIGYGSKTDILLNLDRYDQILSQEIARLAPDMSSWDQIQRAQTRLQPVVRCSDTLGKDWQSNNKAGAAIRAKLVEMVPAFAAEIEKGQQIKVDDRDADQKYRDGPGRVLAYQPAVEALQAQGRSEVIQRAEQVLLAIVAAKTAERARRARTQPSKGEIEAAFAVAMARTLNGDSYSPSENDNRGMFASFAVQNYFVRTVPQLNMFSSGSPTANRPAWIAGWTAGVPQCAPVRPETWRCTVTASMTAELGDARNTILTGQVPLMTTLTNSNGPKQIEMVLGADNIYRAPSFGRSDVATQYKVVMDYYDQAFADSSTGTSGGRTYNDGFPSKSLCRSLAAGSMASPNGGGGSAFSTMGCF